MYRQYFEAMQVGDFATCAVLLHPELTTAILELLDALIASSDSEDALKAFFGTSDPLKLSDYDELQRVVRFLETALEQNLELQTTMEEAVLDIVGVVYEGTHLAHVVHRQDVSYPGYSISAADIVTLRRDQDAWWITLSDASLSLITIKTDSL